MRTSLLALVMLASSLAVADAPVIKDGFAFDTMKPKKACAKVSGALLKKLSAYTCAASEKGTTASGRDAIAECRAKKGASTFMVFAKQADCTEERETQLANGGE